ncbi:hypothetical protein ACFYVL_43875 [Streptomyces sp. NPDC004111]|uniref:hypothetical protein n=1 Tax=Streptomyces sp. NPDC004111 TaxID=3364690 RepID=UPI0036868C5C
MDTHSMDYQPTRAKDENGQERGSFDSPFLASARAEQERNWGTTNGEWTYSAAPGTSAG